MMAGLFEIFQTRFLIRTEDRKKENTQHVPERSICTSNTDVHHQLFGDQGGVENVIAANSLIKVVVWCDGDSTG